MGSSQEKRRHPRVVDRLTLRSFSPGEGSAEMCTTNLSLGGAYVSTNRFIPPMTRVEILLHLPPEDGLDAGPRSVQVEAVVVRIDPPGPVSEAKTYEMALFFSKMERHDRSALARYLSKQSEGK
jgi:PilZ domain-containing protein